MDHKDLLDLLFAASHAKPTSGHGQGTRRALRGTVGAPARQEPLLGPRVHLDAASDDRAAEVPTADGLIR